MFSVHLLSSLFLVGSFSPVTFSAPVTAETNAELAFSTLQKWYNTSSGLWSTTGWWNSANCITTIANLAAIDPSVVSTAQNIFANTLIEAPKSNLQMSKITQPDYNIITFYGPVSPSNVQTAVVINPDGFVNSYYDDEGWWALGWISAYDVTKNPNYLETAVMIFNDMANGATTPCGGGSIWWDKDHTYVNAIANELYLSVAAHLANRIPGNATYLTTAKNQWTWFQNSGMINSQYTINDGLTTTCVNNGGTVWSYNQGVILGALVELSIATSNKTLLTVASTIATAAISALQDTAGILHDPCEPDCGADGSQFKGVFMRNLQILQKALPTPAFFKFITANAAAIWAYDRVSSTDQLSLVWSGPFVQTANASTQSSALDALVAAQALGAGMEANVLAREGFLDEV